MERCDSTQVPCRKAIAEIVKANKNKKSLQLTYEVAKLFQMVMSEENSTLNSVDFKRFFSYRKAFYDRELEGFRIHRFFCKRIDEMRNRKLWITRKKLLRWWKK